jgi:hypothetical protein
MPDMIERTFVEVTKNVVSRLCFMEIKNSSNNHLVNYYNKSEEEEKFELDKFESMMINGDMVFRQCSCLDSFLLSKHFC